MKRTILLIAATVAPVLVPAWGATENGSKAFFGVNAGAGNTTGENNTFIGSNAGRHNTSGSANTLVGYGAGYENVSGYGNAMLGNVAGLQNTGNGNTFLGEFTGYFNEVGDYNVAVGSWAGYQSVGSYNVFLGRNAGRNQAGNHKLVIDNCYSGGLCDSPLIYGEFNNRLLRLDGRLLVAAAGVSRSQLNFSLDHTDTGGYLTSVLDNNFFTSSGARWDDAAGGWVQRSPDGKAVIAGSGDAGYRILTSSATAVGAVAAPVTRLHIDYDGLMGVNTAPVAGRAINTSTGAYLSSGGVWTNASSRDLKENVRELPAERALQAVRELKPVTFNYTNERAGHVGFIAEDVPALVATEDRKGLSAMDVVAVLTKVVQQQDAELGQLKAQVRELAAELRRLR